VNNPEDPSAGSRKVPFSGEVLIECEDFMEDPVPKFFRLAPGKEVRLRNAYLITCTGVEKDGSLVTAVTCKVDPASRGGDAPDGRKIKSTLHWVSAKHAAGAEIRLYDKLFTVEDPLSVPGDFRQMINPGSLKVIEGVMVEPKVRELAPFNRFQFERLGYFCMDPDTTKDRLVINRTITLRDTWAKEKQKI
jgi:glutaminyl-tRNA synthetase